MDAGVSFKTPELKDSLLLTAIIVLGVSAVLPWFPTDFKMVQSVR